MDQLTQTTRDALADLLKARVEAERMPLPRRLHVGVLHAGPMLPASDAGFDERLRAESERKARIVANLNEAIEYTSRALAEAKHAPVIPLPIPHVARARAA